MTFNNLLLLMIVVSLILLYSGIVFNKIFITIRNVVCISWIIFGLAFACCYGISVKVYHDILVSDAETLKHVVEAYNNYNIIDIDLEQSMYTDDRDSYKVRMSIGYLPYIYYTKNVSIIK